MLVGCILVKIRLRITYGVHTSISQPVYQNRFQPIKRPRILEVIWRFVFLSPTFVFPYPWPPSLPISSYELSILHHRRALAEASFFFNLCYCSSSLACSLTSPIVTVKPRRRLHSFENPDHQRHIHSFEQ